MDKKRILEVILGVLLVMVVGFKFLNVYQDRKDNEKPNDSDASVSEVKFKEEYESKNDSNIRVSIPTYNGVQYKSDEELLEILDKGTGVIFLGSSDDTSSRNIVESLIEVVNSNSVSNFYYTDIKNIKTEYKVENDKLVVNVEGTDNYKKLIDILKDYLQIDTLNIDNKDYKLEDKYLDIPTVIVVKNGDIVGVYEGDVVLKKSDVTSEEKEELKKTLAEIIAKISDKSC